MGRNIVVPMLSPEISTVLEKMYGPIDDRFTITQLPEGNAPENIREQWLGVSLPVRRIHAVRFMHGYIGRRMLSVAEDSSFLDAISGKRPDSYNMFPVEIRGLDAIDSLQEAGKEEAAKFWKPYELAMLAFRHYEGIFEKEKLPSN
jgi:hypothetical protein